MDPKYYGLIELVVSFGVVAAFTIQQLWSLREKPPTEPPPADRVADPISESEPPAGD